MSFAAPGPCTVCYTMAIFRHPQSRPGSFDRQVLSRIFIILDMPSGLVNSTVCRLGFFVMVETKPPVFHNHYQLRTIDKRGKTRRATHLPFNIQYTQW